jgi:hypothetical protein
MVEQEGVMNSRRSSYTNEFQSRLGPMHNEEPK